MNEITKAIRKFPITIALTLVALAFFGIESVQPELIDCLEFDVSATITNQLPKVFTCHFLHWTGEHLFWDLGMFTLLCGFCERINRHSLWLTLIASSILIPAFVGVFHPDLMTYRGLSGLDTALFSMAVLYFGLERMRESDRGGMLLYFGLLVGMIGKTIHELFFGTFFVESSSFTPVPIAHIVGAVIGLLVGMFYFFRTSSESSIVSRVNQSTAKPQIVQCDRKFCTSSRVEA